MNKTKFVKWFIEKKRIPRIPVKEDSTYIKYLMKMIKDSFKGYIEEKNTEDKEEWSYPDDFPNDLYKDLVFSKDGNAVFIEEVKSPLSKPIFETYKKIKDAGIYEATEYFKDFVNKNWRDMAKEHAEKREKRLLKEYIKADKQKDFEISKITGKLKVKQKKFITSTLPKKVPIDIMSNIFSFIEPPIKKKMIKF